MANACFHRNQMRNSANFVFLYIVPEDKSISNLTYQLGVKKLSSMGSLLLKYMGLLKKFNVFNIKT